ncbi:MAG: threonine--tRNA ligase, partial [Alphaproteobacteria bacterium]
MSLSVSSRSIAVTLPDGAVRTFETPVTARDVAQSLSTSLAEEAYVAEVDGELVDLDRPLERDVAIRFIRGRDPEALEVIRHDAAHVMAEAVQDLFPGTQVTIGPPIDDGFYYDFARNEPFSTDDLAKIEARMREIVAADKPFVRQEVSREEARRLFERMSERYKLELLDAIAEDQPVSLYYQGDWVDLCRGPHGPSTGRIGPFKLLKVAGAYWRGDSRNAQLQRIYGTAYATDKDLKAHLTRLEEAEKRDHRRLGRELDLFHIQEEAVGSIFWHPKGWTLFRELESYIRRRLDAAGYQEVKTPQLIDRVLWERSGHWEKFRDNMFTLESEERVLAIKPMNCPGHVQIFNRHLYSYRDLPLRLAEFGSCFRNEPSGALHGIMRTRNFTQDDAHIFCTPEQIDSETQAFCALLASIYQDLGFPEFRVKFSDRPAVRAGA